MSDTTETTDDVMIDPVTGGVIDQKKLAEQLLTQVRGQGVGLVGAGGLLGRLAKNVNRPGFSWRLGYLEPAPIGICSPT